MKHADFQRIFYDKEFKKIATKGMQNNISNYNFKKIISILDRNTNIRKGSKILEIGVGTGILMEKMMNHFKNCNFKGVDISENSVKVSREKGLDVVVADANNLCLAGKYDMIYGTAILHHLEDVPKFFEHLSKMLSKDGVILFGAEPVFSQFFYIIHHKLRGS